MAAVGEDKIFSKYLETRKVLIVDPSITARSGVFNIFRQLGSPPHQLVLANTFIQAKNVIEEQKPHVVITEFDLDKRCGLELLQSLREQRPAETKEMLFVIITNNTSQSAVARAAEEDIDAFLIKPFSVEMVRKVLMKAAIQKLKPPPYLMLIDEGKQLMVDGQLDAAEERFNAAKDLDKQPSLAYYYLGQVKFLRKILAEAEGQYETGLNFNRIHYKCMVGLYETLVGAKKNEQAYEVVKRISQYFPSNPKRLSEVLRLAITTKQYDDIEKYYASFAQIEEREEGLIRHVCAALIVCGKYYLSQKIAMKRAIELFQKAAATGTGRTKVLREIIQILIEYNLIAEAKGFLAKFPAETWNSEDYLMMQFFIADAENVANTVIKLGRELLEKKIKNEQLYLIMIRRQLENRLEAGAETLLFEAISLFPDHKEKFEKTYKLYNLSTKPLPTTKTAAKAK